MTYGEEEWREATQTCLQRMEVYDDTSECSFCLGAANRMWLCSVPVYTGRWRFASVNSGQSFPASAVCSCAARHQFTHTLGWLNQWACSRSFGLGTRYVGMRFARVSKLIRTIQKPDMNPVAGSPGFHGIQFTWWSRCRIAPSTWRTILWRTFCSKATCMARPSRL